MRHLFSTIRGRMRSGFTLVEMLIAVSIFAVISTMGASVFTNISRMQRKVNLENAIYQDGRYMMERIVKVLRESTIDYEEYYNQKVLTPYGGGTEDKGTLGANYGYYAAMFYNPGSDDAYGARCNDGSNYATLSSCLISNGTRALSSCLPTTLPHATNALCVLEKRSKDYNTGINPYPVAPPATSNAADKAHAFCEDSKGVACPTTNDDKYALHSQGILYLIDRQGKKKYILGREILYDDVDPTKDHYSLAFLEMVGKDSNGNDEIDSWECAADYKASASALCNTDPTKILDDLTTVNTGESLYNDFVPITPKRSNVVDLKFYVSPLEDPRKAFAETEGDNGTRTQIQPHVTVVLSVTPAASQLSGYPGNAPVVTLQTTVSSRVYDEIESFAN